jgi:hypothetical protein
MLIRIQLVAPIPIRIQLPRIMLIRDVPDPDGSVSTTLNFTNTEVVVEFRPAVVYYLLINIY